MGKLVEIPPDKTIIDMFYEVFEFEPWIKEGEVYMASGMRFSQQVAKYDMYSPIYDYVLIRLLCYLNKLNEHVNITVDNYKDEILEHFVAHHEWYDKAYVRKLVNTPMNVRVGEIIE